MSRHLPFCGDCNCFGCADTDSYIKKGKATNMTDGLVIHNAIIDKMTFENWYYKGEGFTTSVGQAGQDWYGLTVKVESISKDSGSFDSYGEAYRGWTGEAYIIFKVLDQGQPRFFKKSGTVDSYLGISWDGKFAEVKITTKQVTVYEYE